MDILKFSCEGTTYKIHTRDEEFHLLVSLDKIESALKAAGLPFERSDRGNLIQLTEVVALDEKYAKALFKGGKSATISSSKFKQIKAQVARNAFGSKDRCATPLMWPVSRRERGDSGVIFLEVRQIIKFSAFGNAIQVHTQDEVFHLLATLDRIESALQAVGLPFERADRGNLIHMTKMVELDEKFSKAIFAGGKTATISSSKYKKIKALFIAMVRIMRMD
ncbi:LytTR family transcriptional regulator DNA-binding domain-containing protein [Cohnella nanjingensis]